jgi:hypothetical protein
VLQEVRPHAPISDDSQHGYCVASVLRLTASRSGPKLRHMMHPQRSLLQTLLLAGVLSSGVSAFAMTAPSASPQCDGDGKKVDGKKADDKSDDKKVDDKKPTKPSRI